MSRFNSPPQAAGAGFTNVTYQASPADPTATTSATEKMMGLAGTITPGGTKLDIDIEGIIASSGNQAWTLQIRYGTGTAPTNGAAVIGTAAGTKIGMTATITCPFALNAIISGLTPGTAYWIDVAFSIAGGSTLTPTKINIAAHDLP
jgi:hypothetical protein